MNDPYKNLADQYDRFEGAFDQHDPEEVEFFRCLFGQHRVRHLLDCACGTGHHLHMCSQLGIQSVGTDISPAMLQRASQNLTGVGLRIPLTECDYRNLPERFGPDFDAVLCLRTSIQHMPNPSEMLKAFVSMRGVLRKGGILVLTQGTTDRQWREKPRFILAVNEPDFTRLFVIDYEGKGARYNILDVYHGSSPKGMETFSVEYPCMLLKDEQEDLLYKADFSQVTAFGSFGRAPYSKETSKRLILVAVND